MVPIGAVVVYGMALATMVSVSADPCSQATATSHTHGMVLHETAQGPGTFVKQHIKHQPAGKKAPVSPPSIEAMAALSPVLDTAESLHRLTVSRTYDCELTAYGPGFESTGKRPGDPGYGITASGRQALPKHTIAVDPHLIPLGSLVYIDGIGYRVAEDVGGAIRGKHIDIFFHDDSEARIFGVKEHVKVFVFDHSPRAGR